ncbi:MAG: winged helix-turn-helix transcriptional regulator [Actinobacteria bacterium]|nr:MAG: winged helix-turn-helix transcriptional regulator [Actinomycetota bacterium]
MLADAEISSPAALIGDPTRATFLMALSEGRALPASELAQRAGVSASTASVQLAKLVRGGLLEVERSGRHRYYRLADSSVATAIESLAVIAPRRPASSLKQARIGSELQTARTCYDHLAGALGVALFDALRRQRLLTAKLEPTRRGTKRFAELGIDVAELTRRRRPFAKRCLDWTERRHHLAGSLGAAIAARCFELGWIERLPASRAVHVTADGRSALARELAVDL